LRAQADRLGIVSQVEFLGHRDHVEEVLAEADVGVLPSRYEGLSNTLLEFMASGLPTVASRVSGSEDFVVTGRNGWLFPVSDVAALADCLRDARALPVTRLLGMGQQARADVEAASSLDHVVGHLLALYRGAHPREHRKAD
jgi:glycosyltransferase involved in cell wall biosynthesis